MPFTVSHAAAAWPLRWALRERVVLSALLVGTMAPDAEYFVHMGPVRTIGHTFGGLFLMDLPAGLLLLWLFHRLYKRAFTLLAPEPMAAALYADANEPFEWGPPRRFAAICGSILLGSATHVLWDAFTHRRGVYLEWPWLEAPTFSVLGHPVPVYVVLQNGGSVLGLVALALWALPHLLARTPGFLPAEDRLPPRVKAAAWGLIAAVGAAAGVADAWGYRNLQWTQAVHDVSVHGVIGAMAGALWASLPVALWIARLYPAGERAPAEAAAESEAS